jgi:hypothetical protein
MTTLIETAVTSRGQEMNEVNARNLRQAIAVLSEQRGIVAEAGASFAAHLLDLAIMQLKLDLNDISDEELSGLTDFIGLRLAGKSAH